MIALLATLAVQAHVSMAVLTPPVFAAAAAAEIGIGAGWIGVYTSLIYAAACLSSLTSGRLIDRLGPMRLSQVSLLLCAAGSALVALGTVWALALGALAIGLGYGPVTPASSHILIRQTPPARRALVFSVKQTGVPVGGMLAGALVPPIVLGLGWRAAALTVALLGLSLALAVQPLRAEFDAAPAEAKPAEKAGLFAAVRLVLEAPSLRRLALASIAYAAAQLCFASFLAAFLEQEAGRDIASAGAVLAAAQGAGIVARIAWGWAADRLLPPSRVLGLIGLGIAVATSLVGLFAAPWPLAAMIAVGLLHGATGIGWNGVFLAEVARLAPPGRAGAATGGALFLTFFGIVVAPLLFSVLVQTVGGYRIAFFGLAAAACWGGLLCLGGRGTASQARA